MRLQEKCESKIVIVKIKQRRKKVRGKKRASYEASKAFSSSSSFSFFFSLLLFHPYIVQKLTRKMRKKRRSICAEQRNQNLIDESHTEELRNALTKMHKRRTKNFHLKTKPKGDSKHQKEEEEESKECFT
jgi:hypothetical protein